MEQIPCNDSANVLPRIVGCEFFQDSYIRHKNLGVETMTKPLLEGLTANPFYTVRKQCNRCKEFKDFAEFHKDKSRIDGLLNTCKVCRKLPIPSDPPTKSNEKFCRTCGIVKPIDEFYRNNQCPKGRRPKCKQCERSEMSEVRYKKIFQYAKRRAREKCVEFDLDYWEVRRRTENGVCEATGMPFNYQDTKKENLFGGEFSPSIDRIDPSKGYTMDNIRIVCWAFNHMKHTYSDETVLKVMGAFVDKQRSQK